MQIQRIQSLLLLLAIIAVAVFLFIPYGYWDAKVPQMAVDQYGPLVATNQPALLVPGIIALVLMVVSIFLYKNLPLQKSMVMLSGLVVSAMIITVVYLLCDTYPVAGMPEVTVKPLWGVSIALLGAALIGVIFAVKGINADQKLLKSYDRLRL